MGEVLQVVRIFVPDCSFCLERGITRGMSIFQFMSCGQLFEWIVRKLEETLVNQWHIVLRKRYMVKPLWIGNGHENIYVLYKFSLKEYFNNEIGRDDPFCGYQSVSFMYHVQWACEDSGHGSEDRDEAWAPQYGLLLTKTNMVIPTAECSKVETNTVFSIWHHYQSDQPDSKLITLDHFHYRRGCALLLLELLLQIWICFPWTQYFGKLQTGLTESLIHGHCILQPIVSYQGTHYIERKYVNGLMLMKFTDLIRFSTTFKQVPW